MPTETGLWLFLVGNISSRFSSNSEANATAVGIVMYTNSKPLHVCSKRHTCVVIYVQEVYGVMSLCVVTEDMVMDC